ncbi:MAG: ATP-binding cassette domain-containing protein, partial [Lentisphaerota bacterium]
MAEKENIIEFRQAGVPAIPPLFAELREVDFAAREGELVFIIDSTPDGQMPLGDLAEGLIAPEQGSVWIKGRDWKDVPPTEAASLRGRIGRVFENRGWLSNLDMDENITLVQRHFTGRPQADIEAKALALALAYGLPDLPRVRPAFMKKTELRRAEWIRAFLGNPLLIILEQPLRDVYPEHWKNLAAAVQAARARGTAIIWIDDDEAVLRAEKNLDPEIFLRRNG